MGSIFRTADAAGIEKIYLCGITPAPVDAFGGPKSQLAKVSLGAEKLVAWERRKSAAILINKLKQQGYKILSIEQSRKSTPYYKFTAPRDSKRKLALVLGSEVKGLPQGILNRCDKILEIPMKGKMIRQSLHPKNKGKGKESLNVTVAFGIVAYSLLYNS